MKEKQLQIKFDDGSKWHVPARIIASHRAKYYASKGDNYDAEFKFAMDDKFEIQDWAENNMNWEHLRPHAHRVVPPYPYDYDEEWPNAELRVVEA